MWLRWLTTASSFLWHTAKRICGWPGPEASRITRWSTLSIVWICALNTVWEQSRVDIWNIWVVVFVWFCYEWICIICIWFVFWFFLEWTVLFSVTIQVTDASLVVVPGVEWITSLPADKLALWNATPVLFSEVVKCMACTSIRELFIHTTASSAIGSIAFFWQPEQAEILSVVVWTTLGGICLIALATLKSSIDNVRRYSKAVVSTVLLYACIVVRCVRHIEACGHIVHTWLWTLRSHVEPHSSWEGRIAISSGLLWVFKHVHLTVIFAFSEDVRKGTVIIVPWELYRASSVVLDAWLRRIEFRSPVRRLCFVVTLPRPSAWSSFYAVHFSDMVKTLFPYLSPIRIDKTSFLCDVGKECSELSTTDLSRVFSIWSLTTEVWEFGYGL